MSPTMSPTTNCLIRPGDNGQVDARNLTYIRRSGFEGCSELLTIALSNTLTSVGELAFASSGLTAITLPNTVTSVGGHAFYACSGLTAITLPDVSLMVVGDSAFANSGLTAITLPETISAGAVAPNRSSLPSSMFRGCTSLTNVTLPANLDTIPVDFCLGCSALRTLFIPSGVTAVGDGAFGGCPNLTTVHMPRSLKPVSIDPSAFDFHGSCRSSVRFLFPPPGVSNCTQLTYSPTTSPTTSPTASPTTSPTAASPASAVDPVGVSLGATLIVGLIVAAGLYLLEYRPRLVMKRVVARLQALATGGDADATESETYTAAMFEALDHGIDDLVPQLIARGADPGARHPQTHRHAHAIVLRRPVPGCEVLEQLFRHVCIIDADIGASIVSSQPRAAALEAVLTALVRDPPPGRSDTVLHKVAEACWHGHLGPTHAVALSKLLLAADPSLLQTTDARGRTAGDIAMQCDDAVELERLLTVVLHGAFQLTRPFEHLYRSPTAVVLDCRVLPTPTRSDAGAAALLGVASAQRSSRGPPKPSASKAPPLVIKLMADWSSWQREIHLRDVLSGTTDTASVVQIVYIASSDPAAPERVGTMELVRDLHAEHGPGSWVRHSVASTLTAKFPYAIVMEKADRNLLEIIANERLSAEPIGVIRSTAAKVGACIANLHAAGAVHGDIKPRNVVRAADRTFGTTFMLIDLDMAYVPPLSDPHAQRGPSATDVAPDLPCAHASHASAEKIRETSAYASPELLRWAQVGVAGGVAPDPIITGLASAAKADIWSFGVLLYELATGTPLLAHAYDKALDGAEARLLAWDGLWQPEEGQLRRLPRSQGATALVDLLGWCLDPDPIKRPPAMTDVLAHAFFEPATGSMREHFAVQRIRELLAADPGGFRPAGRVMISYSWSDTSFVLDRLCMALAPLVEGMWLDRLGGDQGMGEWTRASMARGVAGADVVIAVVSPQYMTSKNCGLEMALAAEKGKTVIPLMFGVPFGEWPPAKVGETIMTNQFANPQTGDMRLFVDFTDLHAFETKFEKELRPRIDRKADPECRNHLLQSRQLSQASCDVGFDAVPPPSQSEAASIAASEPASGGGGPPGEHIGFPAGKAGRTSEVDGGLDGAVGHTTDLNDGGYLEVATSRPPLQTSDV